jgi:uncharacterized protein (DUF362 family)/Pyruvate/2-oxoacid:ferredoxin oxidoreductase delta subunit
MIRSLQNAAPTPAAPAPAAPTVHSGATVAWRTAVSYEARDLRAALAAVLGELGGMAAFVRPGDRVLINPNFLAARGPDRAVTTHPALTMAVADLAREVGGRVWIGDSPAGALKGVERVWRRSGHLDLAREHRHELVSFEALGGAVEQVDGHAFLLNAALRASDVVISLPKLKTHALTLYTGGVKKVFGHIPGLAKAEFHKLHPHPDAFARMLVALYARVRPRLTILDGIVGMEGPGPASGPARRFGWLLASADAVAVDAVASWLIGLSPERVDTTRLAAARGLGEARLAQITVRGPALADHRLADVRLPDNRWLARIPAGLARAATSLLWARPRVHPAACTGCGACVEMCPTGTIAQASGKARIDLSGCVFCLGCREVCRDGAVEMRLSPVARLVL